MASFFDRIRSYGAVRPDDGRWFAGVAAALARRWGVDPLLVRGGFVILAIFGGVGLLLYGLGWLFLPQPDGRIHAQEVLRGVVTPGFVGGLLCVLLDLGGTGWSHNGWYPGPHPFGGGLLLVGLVVLGVWWFSTGRHRRGPGGWGGPGGPRWGGPGASGGWGGHGWSGHGGSGSGTPAESGAPGAQPSGSSGTGGSTPPGSGSAWPHDSAPPSAGAAPAPGASDLTDPDAGEPGDGPGEAREIPPYGTPPAPATRSFSTAPESAWPTSPAPSWSASSAASRPASGGTRTAVAAPASGRWPQRPDLQRPSHALTSSVLGVALLGAAVVLLWNLVWGVGAPVGFVAAAVALGIVALGIVVAGLIGRRSGGLAPIGILLAVVAVVGSSATGRLTWAGERTWTPGVLASADTSYTLGVGNARLDLRQVSAPNASAASPAEVDARVGVGNLTVVVPAGTAVRVLGTTGAGNIDNAADLAPTSGGQPVPATASRHGPSADVDLQSAPNPVIVVRADVGLGNLTIDSASS